MAPQLEESGHQILCLVGIQALGSLQGKAITIFKEFQPARKILIFFVVEVVDIFEVAVEVVEEA